MCGFLMCECADGKATQQSHQCHPLYQQTSAIIFTFCDFTDLGMISPI